MAGPTFVTGQQAAGSAAGSNITQTLPGAITSGNTLVACASTDDNTVPTATAISDTAGNTWTRIVSEAGVGGTSLGSIAIFVALNVAAGSYGIKFTNTTSFVALSIAEYNPNGQSTADGTSAGRATAGGTPNPGTITTANANDVLLSGATDALDNTTWSAGASYGLRGNVTSSANTTIALQDRTVAATGTYATAYANTTVNGWTACACAIKAAAGGAAPPFPFGDIRRRQRANLRV